MRIIAMLFIAGSAFCLWVCLQNPSRTTSAATPTEAAPLVVLDVAAFRKVRLGNTRRDVEAVLGPPGDFSTVPLTQGSKSITIFEGENGTVEMVREQRMNPPHVPDTMTSDLGSLVLRWKWNGGIIFVAFENDLARVLSYHELRPGSTERWRSMMPGGEAGLLREWERLKNREAAGKKER